MAGVNWLPLTQFETCRRCSAPSPQHRSIANCHCGLANSQTPIAKSQKPPAIYTQNLLPFIHIGPLTIGTFGLLMWAAFIAAFLALNSEIKRRKLEIDASVIILYMAVAGILGAKLWHVIDTPGEGLTFEMLGRPVSLPSFLTHFSWTRGPATVLANFFAWFRQGFAWFGGFVAGIST